MQTMRPHRAGSLFYREKDRHWVAQVGYPSGKRPTAACPHRHAPSDRPCREARSLLAEMLRRRDEGVVDVSRRSTTGAFLDNWLRDAVQVRPATFRRYEQIVRIYLKPALGRTPLGDLTPLQVQAMLNGISRHPQTVAHVRAVLRAALGWAVKSRMLPYNAAELTTSPRIPYREPSFLSAAEARILIEGTQDDRLGALWRLAVMSGMREAELLGLAWDDVDLDTGVLRVRHTLVRVRRQDPKPDESPTGWALAPPKTDRSRRAIPLSASTIAALREHRRRQLVERVGAGGQFPFHGLIFTTRTGWPLYAWHVLAELYKAEERLGLPKVPMHGLRHSTASTLAALGVQPAVAMALLGHTTSRMTDTYTHIVIEAVREAVDRVDATITRGASSQPPAMAADPDFSRSADRSADQTGR